MDIIGTSGDDSLTGTGAGDFIDAAAGDDLLLGLGGDDTLRGGAGADTLDGGAGDDFVDYFDSLAGLIVDLGNPLNNTGDAAGDVYLSVSRVRGSAFNDILIGDSGFNVLRGGLGSDVLNGGGSLDAADYGGAASGVVVSLINPGSNTGEAAGDTFISIEALRGSAFDDVLTGDAGSNNLRGGLGADTLDGSSGFDFAEYTTAATPLVVDLGDFGNNTGEAAGDVFISIEGIRGGNFNDTLIGNAASNALRGSLGADFLHGGSDLFSNPFDFFDFAEYIIATSAVRVDLGNPASNTGEAAGDTFFAIEGLGGTSFNDTLTGNAGMNFLRGNSGADVLNGGAGLDYADYINAPGAIRVNLGNPADNTGEAAGDSYAAIEGLLGSNFDDTLVGNSADNLLLGWIGADVLNGGAGIDYADYRIGSTVLVDLSAPGNNTGHAAGDLFLSIEGIAGSTGNDTLIGDSGDNHLGGRLGEDVLDGAAGFDIARYDGAMAGLFVDLADPAGNTGEAEGDTFVSIEGVSGSQANDTLLGDDGDNLLTGNSGADVLSGRGGRDTLAGGLGNDTLILGVGDEWSDEGGVDTLYSQAGFLGTAAGMEHVTFLGRAGHASIIGTDIGNRFTGNGGANRLDGGGGSDTLEGGRGDDTLLGGAGADRLDGGRGADVMEGGEGNDTYGVGSARDQVVELTGGGVDMVEIAAARYALAANVEHARVLYDGGARVTGNPLPNLLDGGEGNDTFAGGGGPDRFLFDETGNIDLLLDFTPGVDSIAVDEEVFGTDITYDPATGALFYGGGIQFAQLGEGAVHPALTAADIQIV